MRAVHAARLCQKLDALRSVSALRLLSVARASKVAYHMRRIPARRRGELILEGAKADELIIITKGECTCHCSPQAIASAPVRRFVDHTRPITPPRPARLLSLVNSWLGSTVLTVRLTAAAKERLRLSTRTEVAQRYKVFLVCVSGDILVTTGPGYNNDIVWHVFFTVTVFFFKTLNFRCEFEYYQDLVQAVSRGMTSTPSAFSPQEPGSSSILGPGSIIVSAHARLVRVPVHGWLS